MTSKEIAEVIAKLPDDFDFEVFAEEISLNWYYGKDKLICIPEGIHYIKGYCFAYTDIETVVLPSTLISIHSNAFKNCVSLKNIFIVENNIRYISSHAFDGCDNLKNNPFV